MKNNEKIDVDVFKFRPEIDIDLDMEIYTTEHDCTKHDISLEDVELYIEKLLECDMDVRIKIHDKLVDLAKKILKGDELLKGYVIDYDSGAVDRNCKVHAIDWDFAKAWIEDGRKEGIL